MKNQALFSLKDKSKKLKCRLLQFLFGALSVMVTEYTYRGSNSIIFASLFSRGQFLKERIFAPLGAKSFF